MNGRLGRYVANAADDITAHLLVNHHLLDLFTLFIEIALSRLM